MDRTPSPDGVASLHILAGPRTSASWRCPVRLPPGSYRFEARACVRDVQPLPASRHPGAGLRVAGGPRSSAGLVGTTLWLNLAVTFAVTSTNAETQLRGELEARAGHLWIDAASLRLIRLPVPTGPPSADLTAAPDPVSAE
jgi:hypothetical protein